MAFVNSEGLSVSFECTDLIKELKQDIAEFGNNLMVEVITKKVMALQFTQTIILLWMAKILNLNWNRASNL